MCMIEWGDDDWVHLGSTTRKARKQHKCFECSRTIEAGETYTRCAGMPHGEIPDVFKLCAHCTAAGTWLMRVCGGYLYGAIREDLEEHWDETWELHSLWLGRAILGRRRRWLRHDGTLMDPLPAYTGPTGHETAAR
jgi:hypothetical protein